MNPLVYAKGFPLIPITPKMIGRGGGVTVYTKRKKVKGTVSTAQNRLKVVWLDRFWLGHPSLKVFEFFFMHM